MLDLAFVMIIDTCSIVEETCFLGITDKTYESQEACEADTPNELEAFIDMIDGVYPNSSYDEIFVKVLCVSVDEAFVYIKERGADKALGKG